jgi:hypothetical protein
MLGRFLAADRAHATLLCDERIEVVGADPVPMLQVVVPRAPIEALFALASTRVVTRPAVDGPTGRCSLVLREVIEWLPQTTVRAMLSSSEVLKEFVSWLRYVRSP